MQLHRNRLNLGKPQLNCAKRSARPYPCGPVLVCIPQAANAPSCYRETAVLHSTRTRSRERATNTPHKATPQESAHVSRHKLLWARGRFVSESSRRVLSASFWCFCTHLRFSHAAVLVGIPQHPVSILRRAGTSSFASRATILAGVLQSVRRCAPLAVALSGAGFPVRRFRNKVHARVRIGFAADVRALHAHARTSLFRKRSAEHPALEGPMAESAHAQETHNKCNCSPRVARAQVKHPTDTRFCFHTPSSTNARKVRGTCTVRFACKHLNWEQAKTEA